MPADPPDWHRARRRRLAAAGAGLVSLLAAVAVGLGAVAVPRLAWLVPADWFGTLLTVLILGVLAPGVLLASASALAFGLLAGWPRHRLASNAIVLGVATAFAGLWALPMVGLDEEQAGYVVVGGVLALTFLVAPAMLGMMVRGASERPISP